MRRRVLDVAAWLVAWGSATLVAAAGLALVVDVVRRGAPGFDVAFLVDDVRDAGRAGGVGPLVVSTLAILGVAVAIVVPLGIGAAACVAEWVGPRLRSTLRGVLDVLAGVPSIVFGLFGFALFVERLGLGYSLLSGGLTLAVMVLPLFVRIVDQGLADVPPERRRAAAALGLGPATTLFAVLLPSARGALVGALVLGVGRALAETAALVFTAGLVTRMPGSLLDSGRSLSVHVYTLAMDVPGGDEAAATTSMLLLVVLAVINAVAIGALGRRTEGAVS